MKYCAERLPGSGGLGYGNQAQGSGQKAPQFESGDEVRDMLPIAWRSDRIDSYGQANSTQNLQVETQAASSTGAGDGVRLAPLL